MKIIKWNRRFGKCINCGTTEKRHSARGLCTSCYRTEVLLKKPKYLENERKKTRANYQKRKLAREARRKNKKEKLFQKLDLWIKAGKKPQKNCYLFKGYQPPLPLESKMSTLTQYGLKYLDDKL